MLSRGIFDICFLEKLFSNLFRIIVLLVLISTVFWIVRVLNVGSSVELEEELMLEIFCFILSNIVLFLLICGVILSFVFIVLRSTVLKMLFFEVVCDLDSIGIFCFMLKDVSLLFSVTMFGVVRMLFLLLLVSVVSSIF